MAELDEKDKGGGTHSEEGGGAAAEDEEDIVPHHNGDFFQLEEEGFKAYQGRRAAISKIASWCNPLLLY